MNEQKITVQFNKLTLAHWYELVPVRERIHMEDKLDVAREQRKVIMANKYRNIRAARAAHYYRRLPQWITKENNS